MDQSWPLDSLPTGAVDVYACMYIGLCIYYWRSGQKDSSGILGSDSARRLNELKSTPETFFVVRWWAKNTMFVILTVQVEWKKNFQCFKSSSINKLLPQNQRGIMKEPPESQICTGVQSHGGGNPPFQSVKFGNCWSRWGGVKGTG